MYSASVIDIETTSCLCELQITGTPYRVTSDPLWDLELSPPYEASAYNTVWASSFNLSFVTFNPSCWVEAKHCTSSFAVRRLSWLGLDVCLLSRFICRLIYGRVILFIYSRLPTRLWYRVIPLGVNGSSDSAYPSGFTGIDRLGTFGIECSLINLPIESCCISLTDLLSDFAHVSSIPSSFVGRPSFSSSTSVSTAFSKAFSISGGP